MGSAMTIEKPEMMSVRNNPPQRSVVTNSSWNSFKETASRLVMMASQITKAPFTQTYFDGLASATGGEMFGEWNIPAFLRKLPCRKE